MVPDWSCVWALNAWQNCMMLTPLRTECGTYRRSRIGSTGRNLQLDKACNFLLSHLCFLTLLIVLLQRPAMREALSTQALQADVLT